MSMNVPNQMECLIRDDRIVCNYPFIQSTSPRDYFWQVLNQTGNSTVENSYNQINQDSVFSHEIFQMLMWGYIVFHCIETLYYQTCYLQERYREWFNGWVGQAVYMLHLYGTFAIIGMAIDYSMLIPGFMDDFLNNTHPLTFCIVSGFALYSSLFMLIVEIDRLRRPNIVVKIERKKKIPMKHIFIFRGVPGVGKTYTINRLERIYGREENPGTYRIISQNKFFIEDGCYRFERERLGEVERWQMARFLRALRNNVNRIYISNINNLKEMYVNYERIGRHFGYKVRIIELPCENERELFYFHKRNKHGQPYKFSKQVYENWEEDERAEKVEPFIKCHEGDCLPEPVRRSKRILDRELKCYMDLRTN